MCICNYCINMETSNPESLNNQVTLSVPDTQNPMSSPKNNMPKYLIILVIIILLLAGIGIMHFFPNNHTSNNINNFKKTPISATISSAPISTVSPTVKKITPELSVTFQSAPTDKPLPTISIPKLQSFSNFYQYKDTNLDATFYIPNGWTVKNDAMNTGMSVDGTFHKSDCNFDLDYYKDASKCANAPSAFDISIIPPNSDNSKFRLSFDGPTSGFGGSCGPTTNNDSFDFFQAPITIASSTYTFTTARVKANSSSTFYSPGIGTHEDCYYWPEIHQTGSKSIWSKFVVRHWAKDDTTFITMMQILENIKFH